MTEKPYIIVGHSMGGYAALAFTRMYPERVSGLGLVSSQVLADPPERKEGRYKSAADVEANVRKFSFLAYGLSTS